MHQPFEFGWWQDALANAHAVTSDTVFAPQWAPVKDFIKPRGWILDIGCGPRPVFGPCTVIDQLAYKYKAITPGKWWNNVKAYNTPAETLIDGLSFDTIICWNCLDHTIGWRKILDNMLAYGRQGACFAVATDFFEPFLGHPGYKRSDFEYEIGKRFTIIEQREPFGRQLALLMKEKE